MSKKKENSNDIWAGSGINARQEVGRRLKKLREQKSRQENRLIGQFEAVKEADVDIMYTGLSKIETGKQDITARQLFRFAKYYNTTADYILGLTGDSGKSRATCSCDELGLTSEAADVLKRLCKGKNAGIVLSRLIESELFEQFLVYAEQAMSPSIGEQPNVPSEDIHELTQQASKVGYVFIPEREKLRYSATQAVFFLYTALIGMGSDV